MGELQVKTPWVIQIEALQAALTAALDCLRKLDIIEDTPDAAMRDAAITQIEALGVKHGSV